MKQTQMARSGLITVMTCLASGCVVHTTVRNPSRQSIRFESAKTAQTFYDTYLSAADPKGNGSLAIGLSLPLPYWHKTVETDNVRFNAAVQMADTNHDGFLSKDEVQAFAAQEHTQAPTARHKPSVPTTPRANSTTPTQAEVSTAIRNCFANLDPGERVRSVSHIRTAKDSTGCWWAWGEVDPGPGTDGGAVIMSRTSDGWKAISHGSSPDANLVPPEIRKELCPDYR